MFNSIEDYLETLKNEMKDADPALVQDAQADAREHLSSALMMVRETDPAIGEAEALKKIIDEYGTPEETASAYQEVERRTSPVFQQAIKPQSGLERFFGVYSDPRAWGALLYMLIAFVTGVFYFTWAVTGLSLSVSFAIFIFGLPFALLFFLSVRGLALLEGRLVEGLLGVRMPRRPLFSQTNLKWLDRLKALAADRHTWFSILYMFIQFILGTLYFVLFVTILAVSVAFIATPFIQLVWNIPVLSLGEQRIFLPYWTLVALAIFGFLLWTSFMHLARGVAQLHGRMAKSMLVTE